MTIELTDPEAEATYGALLVVAHLLREKPDKSPDEVRAAVACQSAVRAIENACTPELRAKFQADAAASGLL